MLEPIITVGDVVIEPPANDTGSDNGGIVFIDPADIGTDSGASGGTDTGSESVRRRRGRPAGSRNGEKKDTASLTGLDIGDVLKSIHALLSVKLGPHWSLDDDEAKQLDKAIKRAMKHQDMRVTQKQLDYAFAAYVIASIYGSRVVTSVTLTKKPKQGQPQQGGAVFQFPTPQGSA